MSYVINSQNKTIDYDAAVNIMDDEVREALHELLAPCTDQEFFDAYCIAYRNRYDQEFPPNAADGQW